MVEYKFILNPDSNNLEIEEPIGFSNLELSIIRDEKYHGIGFEASTSALKFFGSAANFLKDQKKNNGLKSDVVFQALSRCEGEEDYTEVVRGKLNFGKYKESCGDNCEVSIPIEQEGCQFTFKNRFDQKVDVQAEKSFNGLTTLPGYTGLNFDLELPPKALLVSSEGNVSDDGDTVELDQSGTMAVLYSIRPTFGNTKFETIKTTQLSQPSVNYGISEDEIVSPIILYEDDPKCFNGTFQLDMRMKGYIDVSDIFQSSDVLLQVIFIKCKGSYLEDPITILAQSILANTETVGPTPERFDFDLIYTNDISLEEGDNIYMVVLGLHSAALGLHPKVSCVFEKETYFKLEGQQQCPATTAKVNLVHELLSRVSEFITDYCVRVKSSFYGRFDSEPFSFDDDGCGSLKVLTSGLKIRKAIEDKFFVSFKELLEGLNAIDNIGMDFIEDPERQGKFLVRIEGVDFFYEDKELLKLDAIPEAFTEVEEGRYYSKINVGYKKWEVEKINGLDEINSNREYHTGISTVSNTLEIQSNLIAGSYAIETTRTQSFQESGGADNAYDNEAFVICVKRSEYPYGDIEVEQGNVINPDNIYSPDTLYNYRISPLRNLMRWYKSIVNSYPNYTDSENKLLFGSGTANIIAEGEMESNFCKLERTSSGYDEGVIKENQDLFTTHFSVEDYKPLWENEVGSFDYPLSVKDYKRIKSDPYGYINYQCGNGEYLKGWIKEIKFKPAVGLATFILRNKWQ